MHLALVWAVLDWHILTMRIQIAVYPNMLFHNPLIFSHRQLDSTRTVHLGWLHHIQHTRWAAPSSASAVTETTVCIHGTSSQTCISAFERGQTRPKMTDTPLEMKIILRDSSVRNKQCIPEDLDMKEVICTHGIIWPRISIIQLNHYYLSITHIVTCSCVENTSQGTVSLQWLNTRPPILST